MTTLNAISTQVLDVSLQPCEDEIEPIAEGVWRVGSYMTTRKSCSCGVPSCLHRRLIGAALQNLANYATSWERFVEESRRLR